MSDQIPVDAATMSGPVPGQRSFAVNTMPDDYVRVFDSPDYETGEVVCTSLIAEGIHAVMINPLIGPAGNILPHLGNTWSHAVYVPPAEAEAAAALLAAPSLTEDELIAAQANDPTTLEEAEQQARDA